MTCLTLSVILSVLLHPPWQALAFSWTTTVKGCEGQSVSFPWSVRLADDERVHDFLYYRLLTREPVNNTDLQQDGNGEQIVKTDPHFRFHSDNFNMYINRATADDSGIYTLVLRITRTGGNKPRTYRSRLILSVRAPPTTDGRGLRLETEPKAVKLANGTRADWHVRLSCGPFTNRGQPPVTVIWKSPSGQALSSTSFHNGRFLLALPNPPEVGEYTCQVNPASPALQCAGTNDTVRITATLSLRNADSRVIVLEAKNAELESSVNRLQTDHESTVNQLQTEFESKINHLQQAVMVTDCRDVQRLKLSGSENGVRTLIIYGELVRVYCDQTTDGGGWMVIQRRENGAVDFYRGWDDYVRGFGNISSEHWLGLERIHRLTKNWAHELRVDLWDFGGKTAFAHYRQFKVEGGSDNYRLRVGGYSNSSTAEDALSGHNNMPFTTHDRDNDPAPQMNCAKTYHGAWWYSDCYVSSLNGQYQSKIRTASGIIWYTWNKSSLIRKVEMKIRPV